MYSQLKTINDFSNLLNSAIEETNGYIKQFPEMMIYKNLLQQLQFVKKVIIEESRKPTFYETNSTYIGAIAIKNFENNPIYSEKLKIISYVFDEYKEIDFLKNT